MVIPMSLCEIDVCCMNSHNLSFKTMIIPHHCTEESKHFSLRIAITVRSWFIDEKCGWKRE